MIQVTEVRVPADGFPLGQVLSVLPDATLSLERLVPTGDAVFPYFWVTGADPAEISSALATRDELRSIRHLDEIDGASLFRAEWAPDVPGIITGLRATEVALLSATGADGEWRFELRGEEEALSAFHQYCTDEGLPIVLSYLRPYTGHGSNGGDGLTSDQREALLLALERGYYEESRAATLADLATELGISRQAFAARLRRGYRTLVAETVATADRARCAERS